MGLRRVARALVLFMAISSQKYLDCKSSQKTRFVVNKLVVNFSHGSPLRGDNKSNEAQNHFLGLVGIVKRLLTLKTL